MQVDCVVNLLWKVHFRIFSLPAIVCDQVGHSGIQNVAFVHLKVKVAEVGLSEQELQGEMLSILPCPPEP